MKKQEKALRQILSLMDRFNLSKSDIERHQREYYQDEAKLWLKGEHQPGWYITDDGVSSPNPPDLSKHETFGIWRTERLILCSQVMYQPDTFEKAEEFIRGKSLGPFYFRMADEREAWNINGRGNLFSNALAKCGFPELPKNVFYWYRRKIFLGDEPKIFINNTSENMSIWSEPDEKHLGIYLINLA